MDKLYSLEKSPLFKLKSRKRLLQLLGLQLSYTRINEIADDTTPYYRCFKQKTKKGKERDVAQCLGDLALIQERLQSLMRRVELPEYLFSKRHCSPKANAEYHSANDYVLTIDLKNFYPSCKVDRLASSLHYHFEQEGDISRLLAKLMTLNGCIPQGSTTSSIAAFITNKSMFDEIFSICQKKGLKFSVFVDDLTISSKQSFSVELRDQIIQVIRKNGMPVNYKKIKYFKPYHHKHVTGHAIFEGKVKIEYEKFKKLFKNLLPNKVRYEKVVGLYRYMKGIDSGFKINQLEK
jgi:hypothetical protein